MPTRTKECDLSIVDIEEDCVLVNVHSDAQEIQTLRKYLDEMITDYERMRVRLQDQENQLNLAKFVIDRLRAELDTTRYNIAPISKRR